MRRGSCVPAALTAIETDNATGTASQGEQSFQVLM
jgi:hypothetical protein